MNHVGQMYGVMEEVFQFAGTFEEFPPRSSPPSFNPATILDDTLREIKAKKKIEAAFPMLREGEASQK